MSKPIDSLPELLRVVWHTRAPNWLSLIWVILVGALSYQQGYYSGLDEKREAVKRTRKEWSDKLYDALDEQREMEVLSETQTCTEACVSRHRLPAKYVDHFTCLCGVDHVQTLRRAPDHTVWFASN